MKRIANTCLAFAAGLLAAGCWFGANAGAASVDNGGVESRGWHELKWFHEQIGERVYGVGAGGQTNEHARSLGHSMKITASQEYGREGTFRAGAAVTSLSGLSTAGETLSGLEVWVWIPASLGDSHIFFCVDRNDDHKFDMKGEIGAYPPTGRFDVTATTPREKWIRLTAHPSILTIGPNDGAVDVGVMWITSVSSAGAAIYFDDMSIAAAETGGKP